MSDHYVLMAGAIKTGELIRGVAASNSGVCRRRDLLAAGVSGSAIDRRIRSGAFTVSAAGLYIVENLRDSSTLRRLAVTKWPRAVISHITAADLYGFAVSSSDRLVHVTVPHGSHVTMPGVQAHQSRSLDQFDVVDVAGSPTTTAARTIVDLAPSLGSARLKYIVQTQNRDDNPTLHALAASVNGMTRRGVKGMTKLLHVLDGLMVGEPVGASCLESAVNRLLADYGIDGFRPQFKPPWYDGLRGIVDFANPDLGIVIEADGRRWHQRDQDMTEDRRRDRLANAYGWTVIRVTWAEVTQRPMAIANEIAAIVSRRRGAQDVA